MRKIHYIKAGCCSQGREHEDVVTLHKTCHIHGTKQEMTLGRLSFILGKWNIPSSLQRSKTAFALREQLPPEKLRLVLPLLELLHLLELPPPSSVLHLMPAIIDVRKLKDKKKKKGKFCNV